MNPTLMTPTPGNSRQIALKSLIAFTLAVMLVSCGDYRTQQACADYFGEGNLEGFQVIDGGIALHIKSNTLWYRCPAGSYFTNNACQGDPLVVSWDAAQEFSKEFSQNSSYTWQLASNDDFKAITTDQCLNPALNTNIFPAIPVDNYWTADSAGIARSRKCMIYTYQGQFACRENSDAQHLFFLVTRNP